MVIVLSLTLVSMYERTLSIAERDFGLVPEDMPLEGVLQPLFQAFDKGEDIPKAFEIYSV